jgi:CDP-diacylglycerol pyrophosphatase
MTRRILAVASIAVISVVAAIFFYILSRNVLWSTISKQCVPNYMYNKKYSPCTYVDLNQKYVVYKIDGDRYQYLLMPTEPISGLEDPALARDGTAPYIGLAWSSRSYLVHLIGRPIDDRYISLAVNPINARSQDELHVHISCLSDEIRAKIESKAGSMTRDSWQELLRVRAHIYMGRAIDRTVLNSANIFNMVRDYVAKTGRSPIYSGLALVAFDRDKFLVLTAVGGAFSPIGPEEIQDHSCTDAIAASGSERSSINHPVNHSSAQILTDAPRTRD